MNIFNATITAMSVALTLLFVCGDVHAKYYLGPGEFKNSCGGTMFNCSDPLYNPSIGTCNECCDTSDPTKPSITCQCKYSFGYTDTESTCKAIQCPSGETMECSNQPTTDKSGNSIYKCSCV